MTEEYGRRLAEEQAKAGWTRGGDGTWTPTGERARKVYERLRAQVNGAGDGEGMVDLVDFAEVHDSADDLVEGLFLPGRWTQMPAAAKAGKSTLLVWITLELSEGRDPFDGTPIEPAVVLYADGEMGRDDLEELIRSCGRDPLKLPNWHATTERPRLDTPAGSARLLRRVDDLSARLVILDGLNGFVDPGASENDDTTWRPMFSLAILPLKERGVAVGSADNKGKDTGKGSRGSSVKVDKPDAVIEVRRIDGGTRLAATHRRGSAFLAALDLTVDGLDGVGSTRFRRSAEGYPSGTQAAVAVLDRLGVSRDDGRRKVRARLRDEAATAEADGRDSTEFHIANDVLGAALRFRKLDLSGRPSSPP